MKNTEARPSTDGSKSAAHWTEGLKPGDKVTKVHIGSGRRSFTPETVLRVTKTMVVLVEGSRYRIGRCSGIGITQGRIDPIAATGSAQ